VIIVSVLLFRTAKATTLYALYGCPPSYSILYLYSLWWLLINFLLNTSVYSISLRLTMGKFGAYFRTHPSVFLPATVLTSFHSNLISTILLFFLFSFISYGLILGYMTLLTFISIFVILALFYYYLSTRFLKLLPGPSIATAIAIGLSNSTFWIFGEDIYFFMEHFYTIWLLFLLFAFTEVYFSVWYVGRYREYRGADSAPPDEGSVIDRVDFIIMAISAVIMVSLLLYSAWVIYSR